MAISKEQRRRNIRYRIRGKISGTDVRPRLSVYRSNKEIYAQIINDLDGKTLVSASSREANIPRDQNKVEQSKAVGKRLAEKALAENIQSVVFDRGGYLYHGRIKALGDGAREGGLKF